MNRKNFLKTGLGGILLGLIPFNIAAKSVIKKNPVIKFTPENLSQYNVGTYFINTKADVEKNVDYSTTVVSKFVYQIGGTVNDVGGKKIRIKFPKYGLCNALTDGWTHWVGSKQELCDYLNNNPYGETYRVLTEEELIYIITQRSNKKQLVRRVD